MGACTEHKRSLLRLEQELADPNLGNQLFQPSCHLWTLDSGLWQLSGTGLLLAFVHKGPQLTEVLSATGQVATSQLLLDPHIQSVGMQIQQLSVIVWLWLP